MRLAIKRFFAACCLLLMSMPVLALDEVKIGILAYRPKPQVQAQWAPLAHALDHAIPGYKFVIEVYALDDLSAAVASRQVDFVLTNPGHYVLMVHRIGLSVPLASLSNLEQGKPVASFGGVIFTRADRVDISRLKDIRDKSVAIVSTDSLGGYQMQAYELLLAGIHLPQDAHVIVTKQPQDNVVRAVLTGQADAGFVRTGLLEGLAREGKLDLTRIKILNLQDLPGFPAQTSTRLYPEWLLASQPYLDKDLKRKVTSFILNLEENKPLRQALEIHGFDVPADYSSVETILRELRMPPFDAAPAFTFSDVLQRYRLPIDIGIAAIALILLLGFNLFLSNRRLVSEKAVVQKQTKMLLSSNQRFDAVLRAVPDLMFELARDGRYLNVWGVRGDLLAAPEHALLGHTVEEMLPAAAAQVVRAAISEAAEKGFSFGREYQRPLPRGDVWFELSVSRQQPDPSLEPSFIVLSRDITKRKQDEIVLRHHKVALETTHDGFWMVDEQGILLEANQAYAEMSGYSVDELRGMHVSQLEAKEQSVDEVNAHMAKIIAQGYDVFETRHRHKDGHEIDFEISTSFVPESRMFVAFCRDITLRKAAERQIEHLAFFDPLTGLPNRRLLHDRLGLALASCARSGRISAVLFVDLDNFKIINDTLGHDIGDLMLLEAAKRIQSCIREGDTVAHPGGDEYVVILNDVGEQAIEAASKTESVGEKMLAMLSQPYLLSGHDCHSTSSIGATLFGSQSQSTEDIMKQADIAMYQAKKEGRNTLRFFDPEMQASINSLAALEDALRAALVNQEFQLYFQIQVDDSGRYLGAEALIRWIHPVRGVVPPAQFISLAEGTGQIVPIGKWVLETACAQLNAWQQDARTCDLVLAVNVSAKQFHQADFVSQVQTAVNRFSIDPRLLKLELTESMLVENVEGTITTMSKLREIGVRFSLDDFGTGYSSLQYLKRLPLDQVKIDQSFVRDITTDSSDKAIVRTIIAMADSLNLEVIAEGVETEAQRQLLLKNGCKHFQGYLFGEPVPIEKFVVSLRQG